jgi:hypothetical protein
MADILITRDEFLALATFGSVRMASGRIRVDENTPEGTTDLFACAPDFGIIDSNNWLLLKITSANSDTSAFELTFAEISSFHPLEDKGRDFWNSELKPYKLRIGKTALTEAFVAWAAQAESRRRARLISEYILAHGFPEEPAFLTPEAESRLNQIITSLDGDFGSLSFEIKACLGMSGITSFDDAGLQGVLSQADLVRWPHARLVDGHFNGQFAQTGISLSCIGLLARIRGLIERGELDSKATDSCVALIRQLPSPPEAGLCSQHLIAGLDDAALHASIVQAHRD